MEEELSRVNYTEINNNIFKTLTILRNYPKSIILGDLTYYAFSTYLAGYVDALGNCAGVNLKLKITHSYQQKIKQQAFIFWTDYIPYYYNENSEEEHINILIDVTEEFFQENPKWYL